VDRAAEHQGRPESLRAHPALQSLLTGPVYFSDPAAQRIRQIVGCDGNVCPLPCLGGENGQPGRFNTPRGLVLLKDRRGLFAADSRNHRIQVVDPDTASCWRWLGQPGGGTGPGSVPGRLKHPMGVGGGLGEQYLRSRLRQCARPEWNAAGDLVDEFWTNALASHTLDAAVDVCAVDVDDAIWVFIVEGSSPSQVFVFDVNGNR